MEGQEALEETQVMMDLDLVSADPFLENLQVEETLDVQMMKMITQSHHPCLQEDQLEEEKRKTESKKQSEIIIEAPRRQESHC